MLKSVILTQHKGIEHWNRWIVAVPDGMDDETIADIMKESFRNGDLDLVMVEESDDDDDLNVNIYDVPPNVETPDITLTVDGDVIDEPLLAAFSTEELQMEIERRQVKDGSILAI